MLTCRAVAEDATNHMEGAAPLKRRAAIWLHLRFCSNCREYVRQLGRSIGLVKRAAETPAPPAQEDALVALFAARRQGGD
jgi:predicted anti-sigma-YlaC factor YlaD